MKKKFCGECMKLVQPKAMWSDFTCKKCAENLGLGMPGETYKKGNFD
jgi:transcription initiation factor IIE alpha subunit